MKSGVKTKLEKSEKEPTLLKNGQSRVLETRPIYHKIDKTIRGHMFCSFLALVLRKELDRRLDQAGHCFEWADVKQDLKALQETVIEDNGKALSVRSECLGTCGNVFQAVGVAIPPTI
jgi:transposase